MKKIHESLMFTATCVCMLCFASCDNEEEMEGPSQQEIESDIIGLWEGVEMTGEETYGDAEACIEYKADGTYTYYVKSGEGWIPSANVGNEYNVNKNQLTHRWRPEPGADYQSEWWNIASIKDGQMKWTALRKKEDGTRFNTTFTWKKVKFNPTFYVSGKQFMNASYIFKDNDLLYRLEDNSYVFGLAVMPDGIYAFGSITLLDFTTFSMTTIPAVWKNGERLDIDFGGIEGYLSSMVVAGDKWVCTGVLMYPDGSRQSVLVENGEIIFRSETNVEFQNIAYSMSGHYYALSADDSGVTLWCIDANTKQLVSKDLIVQGEEGFAWQTGSIYANKQDIAICLNKTHMPSGMDYNAYCWINGELKDLGYGYKLSDLTSFDGDWIVGGSKGKEFNEDGSRLSWTAFQWVNGTTQDFSHGQSGNSHLALLKNWNGKYLFQCLVDDSENLKIYSEGNLLEEIQIPEDLRETFAVSCWDVVMKTVPVQ